MTKHILTIITLFLLAACSKEISQRSLPDFEPATLDQNGGNWKPILLTAPTDIQIEEPLAVNSAAYQKELTDIRDIKGSMS